MGSATASGVGGRSHSPETAIERLSLTEERVQNEDKEQVPMNARDVMSTLVVSVHPETPLDLLPRGRARRHFCNQRGTAEQGSMALACPANPRRIFLSVNCLTLLDRFQERCCLKAGGS